LLKDTTVVTWKKEKSGGLYGCKSKLTKIPYGEYSAESGPKKTGYILRSSPLSLSVWKLFGKKNRILRILGQTGILSAKRDVSRKKTWGTINCRGYGVGGVLMNSNLSGRNRAISSAQGGRALMRLLLVEDDKKIASFIKKGLEEEGYAVDWAAEGETGFFMGQDEVYDLLILDVNLPHKDGLSILKNLRSRGIGTPVLLLTVRATIEDRVIGLDTGADDYLPKPFAFQELLARVRALLRRRTETEPPVLKVADLSLDPAKRKVFRGGQPIDLTSKEFSLLEYLMRNKERVVTRTMISEHVWDHNFDTSTNVIDVYVNYLRKKIDLGCQSRLIHTVRGVGYVIKEE
jgi:heavy metal response regulator